MRPAVNLSQEAEPTGITTSIAGFAAAKHGTGVEPCKPLEGAPADAARAFGPVPGSPSGALAASSKPATRRSKMDASKSQHDAVSIDTTHYDRNEQGITDAITDLLHLADELGINAEALLSLCHDNYHAEAFGDEETNRPAPSS